MPRSLSADTLYYLTVGGLRIEPYAQLLIDGVWVGSLTLVGGSLSFDRSATTRTTGSFSVAEWSGIVPVTVSPGTASAGQQTAIRDQLAKFGISTTDANAMMAGTLAWTPKAKAALVAPGVTINTGVNIYTPSGGVEFETLGMLRIASRTIRDTAAGVLIDIQAYDYSRYVAAQPFVSRYVIPKDKNVAVAIRDIAWNLLPYPKAIQYDTTTETTPRIVLGGRNDSTDPWTAITDLADSIGFVAYFDSIGVLRVLDEPTVNKDNVTAELIDGDGGTLVEFAELLDDTKLVNGVIVEGSSASKQKSVRASYFDIDPDSPSNTTINGQHAIVHRTKKVHTASAAYKMARRILRRRGGYKTEVTVTCFPRPDIEVGDVVRVRSQRAGIDRAYRVEKVDYPLDLSPMTLTLSRRLW